jgi:hypothetical protein
VALAKKFPGKNFALEGFAIIFMRGQVRTTTSPQRLKNMTIKITESRLRGIVREELSRLAEEGGKNHMTVEVKGATMATSEAVKSEQRKGEDILRKVLGDEKANALIENRKKRDGDGAHITLLSPADTKKAIAGMAEKESISKGEAERRVKALAAEGVPENFTVKGVGKAEKDGKEAYYLGVEWPAGDEFRKSLGLPTGDEAGAQDFHITLGFGDGGDVHGVRKTDTSVGKTTEGRITTIESMRITESRLREIIREALGSSMDEMSAEVALAKEFGATTTKRIAGAGGPPRFQAQFDSEEGAKAFVEALPRGARPSLDPRTYTVRFETARPAGGRGGAPGPVEGHLRVHPWLLLDPGVNEALQVGLARLGPDRLEFVRGKVHELGMAIPETREEVLSKLAREATPRALEYQLDGLGALQGVRDRVTITGELSTRLSGMLVHLLAARGGWDETSAKVAAVVAQALEDRGIGL